MEYDGVYLTKVLQLSTASSRYSTASQTKQKDLYKLDPNGALYPSTVSKEHFRFSYTFEF
jgi:hypothetical protein